MSPAKMNDRGEILLGNEALMMVMISQRNGNPPEDDGPRILCTIWGFTGSRVRA